LYTATSSIKGSKSLAYPIGLITADEISLAGGAYLINNDGYYLYNGQGYMTLSPFAFNGVTSIVMGLSSTGYLGHNGAYYSYGGVRPLINLKADVTLSGKGTMANPYVVL